MCEITCENFYSELPAIETAIKESAFISIDMEFSKLHENIPKPFTFFDTNCERYKKLRNKVSDITCIQLGLSIFIYESKSRTFKSYTYSFYTYPQTFYKSDSVVNFETACVEFLCKHQFDFNKLFRNRVPYLTDEQESQMKTEMLEDTFFDKYFETNLKFRTIEEELIKTLRVVGDWYINANYEEQTCMEINGCNEPAYIILMQYYLLKKFKDISIEENPFGLNITKVRPNKNAETLRNQIFENLKINLLNKMMGIKYIINLISTLKKPLVGHNCALDILILSNQFFKPLPENFKDYRCFLSNNFGPIYDTKLLCKEVKRMMPKNDVWLGSSLSEIYSYLKCGYAQIYSEALCIELVGIEESENMKWHHAGWDAYYTGYCFLKMMHIIKNISSKTETIHQKYTLTELIKSVEFSKNKLYTYRSASNSIDLECDEKCNNQINHLVIQNKGLFYKAIDLKELHRDLKQICNFDVQLLSKYTALIAIPIMNNRIIYSLNSKYRVENFLQYQDRKRKQHIVSLSLIILSTSIIIYLKK